MIAHVAGVPFEELVPPALAGGTLWLVAVTSLRSRLARVRRAARRVSTREVAGRDVAEGRRVSGRGGPRRLPAW